jgi:hypothetical protein
MNAKSRLQQWVDSLPDSAENMTAEEFLATFGQISLTNEDWIFQALDLGLSRMKRLDVQFAGFTKIGGRSMSEREIKMAFNDGWTMGF